MIKIETNPCNNRNPCNPCNNRNPCNPCNPCNNRPTSLLLLPIWAPADTPFTRIIWTKKSASTFARNSRFGRTFLKPQYSPPRIPFIANLR